MNKLQGFYELQSSGLPTVPWKKYEKGTKLDRNILWTIRSAIWEGNDLNLPRKVGVTADEAEKFAEGLQNILGEDSLIIYYPYFIAEKSGVLEVANHRIVIEAAKDDLWNLVTFNKVDVSIHFDSMHNMSFTGDSEFLNNFEIDEIIKFSQIIKRKYQDILLDSKSVFLEWSFAYESNINKEPVGQRKLVFYELRSVG